MDMSNQELADYHLATQTYEIAEMSNRSEPFENVIAGIHIRVLPHVYPGGIDSELMCGVLDVSANDRILDLCTGTGIIALKAAQMGAKDVIGVDLNPQAIKNAELNKQGLGLNNITFLEGSLFEPVRNQKFDLITINPPYTDKKPANKTEICFWDENNQTTRDFFSEFQNHLNPGGKAYIGWADFSSLELIKSLAHEHNLSLKKVASKATQSGKATFLVYKLVP